MKKVKWTNWVKLKKYLSQVWIFIITIKVDNLLWFVASLSKANFKSHFKFELFSVSNCFVKDFGVILVQLASHMSIESRKLKRLVNLSCSDKKGLPPVNFLQHLVSFSTDLLTDKMGTKTERPSGYGRKFWDEKKSDFLFFQIQSMNY